MTTTGSKANWQNLPSFTFPYFSPPVFVNKDEFIICPSKHSGCKSDGVYSFNIKQANWSKIIDLPQDLRCFNRSAVYHSKTKSLYVSLLTKGCLLKVDLNSRKLTTQFPYEYNGNHARIILIQDQLHLITPKHQHNIFNINVEETQPKQIENVSINIFNDHFYDHLIYLKSQKCILSFGRNKSYKFFISNKIWKEMNQVRLPQDMAKFGMVTTRDERYIFFIWWFNTFR